jgi:hypothetical protein
MAIPLLENKDTPIPWGLLSSLFSRLTNTRAGNYSSTFENRLHHYSVYPRYRAASRGNNRTHKDSKSRDFRILRSLMLGESKHPFGMGFDDEREKVFPYQSHEPESLFRLG